jgi:hypothetical protein
MPASKRTIRPSVQAVAQTAALRELAPWMLVPLALVWAFLGFLAS